MDYEYEKYVCNKTNLKETLLNDLGESLCGLI